MDSGKLGDEQLTVFAASDDAEAKQLVLDLAKAIGFDAVDAGPLAGARLLEPLGYLNIQLGYVFGLGSQIGLRLLRRAA
jgi:predicted dinucleotide-binding enzyme